LRSRSEGVIVPELLPVSAAARAGVQPMDIILQVDGESVGKTATSVQFLVDKIKDSPGEELTLHLRRGVKELDVRVTPDKASDGGGRIGVQVGFRFSDGFLFFTCPALGAGWPL
jgi:C-terminal processing protease CtpA/Prc